MKQCLRFVRSPKSGGIMMSDSAPPSYSVNPSKSKDRVRNTSFTPKSSTHESHVTDVVGGTSFSGQKTDLKSRGPRLRLIASYISHAEAFKDDCEWAKSEQYYMRAWKGLISALGPNNYDIVKVEHDLGLVCRHQGRYTDAEGWFTEALDGWKYFLGSGEYDDFGATLSYDLGLVHLDQSRFDVAEKCLFHALQTRERLYGPLDSMTLEVTRKLARVRKGQGMFSDAQQLLERNKSYMPESSKIAAERGQSETSPFEEPTESEKVFSPDTKEYSDILKQPVDPRRLQEQSEQGLLSFQQAIELLDNLPRQEELSTSLVTLSSPPFATTGTASFVTTENSRNIEPLEYEYSAAPPPYQP